MNRLRVVAVFALLGAAVAAIYSRTTGYGFFSDDFEWLVGAQQFDPGRLFDLSDRTHFYRPVLELYFHAALAECGRSASCFHWLSVLLHAGTSGLVAALAASISRSRMLGALAGLLFAVQPGPTEAVIWISAVSELLATAFFVLTVWLFWRALVTKRRAFFAGSLCAFVACLFTHESGATLLPVLFLVMWLLHPEQSPERGSLLRRLLALTPFAVVTAVYLAIAYIVNSRSYLVTEGQYGIGMHVFTNVAHALLTLAVARRDAIGLAIVLAAYLWAATAAPPRVRFYALWTIVTLLPFAGFLGGLSSRYLYLPAVGFAGLAAEVLWWARQPLAAWSRAGVAVWWILTIALTARFASFATKNVRVWEHASAPYREYADTVRRAYPTHTKGAQLEVPPPPKAIAPHYVPSLLRWRARRIRPLRPSFANVEPPSSSLKVLFPATLPGGGVRTCKTRPESALVVLRPRRVVLASAGRHPIGRRGKPCFVAVEPTEQLLEAVATAAAKMNVGRLLAHQAEESRRQSKPLVAVVLGHLDLCHIRRELAQQPRVMYLEVWVWITNRVLEQCRGLRGHVVLLRMPIQGRRHEGFRLARVAPAVFRRDHGGKAPPAKTAQSAR